MSPMVKAVTPNATVTARGRSIEDQLLNGGLSYSPSGQFYCYYATS